MKYKKKIWLLVIFLILIIPGYSQHSNTMYHLKGVVPQSYLMNPAHQPVCGFHAGLPGAAPLDVRLGLPFSVNDILFYDNEIDSTVTFLHPGVNQEVFKGKIRKNNYLHGEVSTGIASLGFRSNDYYFSLDIRHKGYMKMNIPGDFLHFLLELNEDGEEFNFSEFDFTTRLYNEYSIGVSRKYWDNLTFGVRGKMLFGIADLSMQNSDLNLKTSKDLWTATSNITLNANLPFAEIPMNEKENYALDSIQFNEEIKIADLIGPGLFNNFGMGIDLGVTYQPIDRISLSASIVDLGFIRWKGNTFNISQQSTFEFDGVSVDSVGSEKFSEYLADSLKNNFTLTESKNAYNTYLPSKIYIGGEYFVSPYVSLGLLSMSEIYHQKIRQELTFSTNFNPGKVLALSFSFSYLNYSFNNLGFGMSSKLGPLNLYMVLDNIPMVMAREVNENIIIPHKTKNFTFKLGMNLVFGCNREKRLMKDKPMIQ